MKKYSEAFFAGDDDDDIPEEEIRQLSEELGMSHMVDDLMEMNRTARRAPEPLVFVRVGLVGDFVMKQSTASFLQAIRHKLQARRRN